MTDMMLPLPQPGLTDARRAEWAIKLRKTKGTEQKFLKECEILARELGYLTCHVFPSQVRAGKYITTTSSPGFPDLHCLRRERLVVLELKRDAKTKGQVKRYASQRHWLALYQTLGTRVEAYFAHPDLAEEIIALLEDAD